MVSMSDSFSIYWLKKSRDILSSYPYIVYKYTIRYVNGVEPHTLVTHPNLQ